MTFRVPRALASALIVAMILASLFVVSLAISPSARAQALDAQAMDMCDHVATIPSLRDCVETMATQDIITNQGVANSLLAELAAAQAAVNRGQSEVAVSDLKVLTREVLAQAGKSIAQPYANHLIQHAQMVFQVLEGSDTA